MSKLGAALGHGEFTLLGWSDPFQYEAGQIEGNKFDAGVSMRVWFAVDDHDVQVVKVKTAEVPAIHAAIKDLGRGTLVKVSYRDKTVPELVTLERGQAAKAA